MKKTIREALEESILDKWVPLAKGLHTKEHFCFLCRVGTERDQYGNTACSHSCPAYSICGEDSALYYAQWVSARNEFGIQSQEAIYEAEWMLLKLVMQHPIWSEHPEGFFKSHEIKWNTEFDTYLDEEEEKKNE